MPLFTNAPLSTYDTAGPTPSSTSKPHRHQRQELNTGSSDVAVRDDPNGTPEGSTETTISTHTAVRVLTTATPPVRVTSTANSAWTWTSPTTSVTDNLAIPNHSTGH